MAAPTPPPQEPAAIGVDVGGHGLKCVLVDAEGRLLAERVETLDGEEDRAMEQVEARLLRCVEVLTAEAGSSAVPCGVGVPGFLEGSPKLLRASPNFPGWEDLAIEERLGNLLGRDVVVENDAHCAVLGEVWQGAAQGCDDVLLLTLGTGVGTGAVVGGRLLRGARGLGPEGGHIALYPGGRRCGCGQRGCLEAYASGPGLALTAEEAWYEEGLEGRCPARSALEVFEAESEAGGPSPDHWASRAVERYCLDLAQGIAGLVHLLAPELVVLGGGISGAFARIGGPIEEELRRRCIPAFVEGRLSLRPAELGDLAGAFGAASWALTSRA
ncbi:MAG: ROK family protein [Myxococcota bacterium]|nr:ROK family protein [Myxococcota bacterium]